MSIGADGEIVYGRRAVAEARRGRRRVRRVWTSEDTTAAELDRIACSPDHQGIVAEVDPFAYCDPDELLELPDALIVALDQVQDPRNLGAVVRTADAAGATGLVITERRSASVTAVAAKTSAGAVEHLPIARVTNLADWLERAKRAGAWTYGAVPTGGIPHTDADLTGPIVIALGSEGQGLRRLVAERCDALVTIPAHGRVASLNVSAAAAVMLFEAVRQRALK